MVEANTRRSVVQQFVHVLWDLVAIVAKIMSRSVHFNIECIEADFQSVFEAVKPNVGYSDAS